MSATPAAPPPSAEIAKRSETRRSNSAPLSDQDRARIRAQIIGSYTWPAKLSNDWGIGLESAAAMIKAAARSTTPVAPTTTLAGHDGSAHVIPQ